MGEALAGTVVLDLGAVGPASRCTALLADLGADVVRVARPSGGAVPPWWAYGAGRRTRTLALDLKDEQGRAAFLELAASADVVVESNRPGVADRLGIGYGSVSAVNPRVVYAALTGYGQDGPYAGWAGHDLDYLAVGGFLATQGTRADGGPALPGATVADSAGGGLQAAVAILAALLRRERTGCGAFLDVSATEGVLSLMALHLDEYLATGVAPGPGSSLLTGRYACYDVYRAGDGRWLAVAAIEPAFFANLCRALGLDELAADQYADDRQDALRNALAEAFAARDRDAWVADLAPKDTCVAPVLSVPEVAADTHHRARAAFATLEHAVHGRAEQVGPVVAGAARPATAFTAPPETLALLSPTAPPASPAPSATASGPATEPATPRPGTPGAFPLPHARAGSPAARPVRKAPGRGPGREAEPAPMSPEEWVGFGLEAGPEEVWVERGHVLHWCEAVDDANPLYWDADAAEALTGGWIAPPSMLSVWMRPLRFSPHRDGPVVRPLELHFRLKDALGLPEGIVAANAMAFHTPVRLGDRLTTRQVVRDVGAERTNRLGTGRSWTIAVTFRNQHGEVVGVETYEMFGYRRPHPADSEHAPDTRPDPRGDRQAAGRVQAGGVPHSPPTAPEEGRGPGGGLAVRVGMGLAPLVVPVTATTVVMGASASRDWQPQHHDHAWTVAKVGPGGIFLNTPSQAGWIERCLTAWSGPRGRLARLEFRMRRPICPGDEAVFAGEVTAVTPDGDVTWADIALTVSVGAEVATRCTARIALPSGPDDNPWRRHGAAWTP